jgi:hypothetical protein
MSSKNPDRRTSVGKDGEGRRDLRHFPETYNSLKFQKRYAAHVVDGLKGAEIFRALAEDPLLPAFFMIRDVSAIVNISREGLRSRRSRGQPPGWSKPTKGQVQYPREAVCDWLANSCIQSKPNE